MKRSGRILLCFLLLLSLFALTACEEEPAAEVDCEGSDFESGEANGQGEEYDENGNLIRMTWYDETGYPEYVEEYEYDAENHCTKMAVYEDGALVYAFGYEYEDGCCVRERLYDESGELLSIDEFIRDDDGMICGSYSYGYFGDYRYNCIQYDAARNPLREEQYDEDGEVYYWIEYTYEDGVCVKGTENDGNYKVYFYDEEGVGIGYEYYDADGDLIEEYYY